MQETRVLALKYRPKNFQEIIGQGPVRETLSMALNREKLSHAYLFSGLRGSGKTSTARIFAKALLCQEGVNDSPCQKCQNCISALEGRHIDIIELDGASNRKIDDIRDLIEHTRYKPAIGRFKIFIIDEVHMLTKEAFNALLKTLEEPPSYVKFILATTDPQKLPPTILSRTQHFRFKKIMQTDMVNHLEHILNIEDVSFEKEAIEIISRCSNGSLRDALTMLDQAIVYAKGAVDQKSIVEMLGILDPKKIEEFFENIFNKNIQEAINLIMEIEDSDPEMVVDEILNYLKIKLFKKDPNFTTMILDRFFRVLSDTRSLLFQGADSGFALGLMVLKLQESLLPLDLDKEIEKLELKLSDKNNNQIIEEQKKSLVKIEKINENILDDDGSKKFDQLIAKVYDRDMDLGECFENSVFFKSFQDDTLAWESCADGECKDMLRNYYSVIKTLVMEVYGVETKIQMIPIDKKKTKELNQIQNEETQSSTSGSCLSKENENQKEYDKEEILNHISVKKVVEKLSATSIKVISKV